MSPALSTSHTFRCGPIEPIPTRWFRITLTKPSSLVEVRSHASGDDYLIEVHSAGTGAWHVGARPDRRVATSRRSSRLASSAADQVSRVRA